MDNGQGLTCSAHTTTGYGDIQPTTVLGQMTIVMLLMVTAYLVRPHHALMSQALHTLCPDTPLFFLLTRFRRSLQSCGASKKVRLLSSVLVGTFHTVSVPSSRTPASVVIL